MNAIIIKAILDANKLGKRGLRVIGIIEPTSASEMPWYRLAVCFDEPKTASETPWWEK